MSRYIAIVEDPGPEAAIGIWFPDLPGCFSAGDTVEEAMDNAPEAIAAYATALARDGRPLPKARSLVQLKDDPAFVADAHEHMVALVEVPEQAAAE